MDETGYTPKWKDNNDNVVFFPATNTLFETVELALQFQRQQWPLMMALGLEPEGVFEFTHQDGKFQVSHVVVEMPKLGRGCCIDGPIFNEMKENQDDSS